MLRGKNIDFLIWKKKENFLGGPLAKTPCFQCRGLGVQSLVRELDPHAATEDPAFHN